MAEQVEISSFDLRYEGFRMRSPGTEKAMLLSILQKGIVDPLHGIDDSTIGLDPFMGIGNTSIACDRLKINCIGFEIDKAYFNTNINLLEKKSLK